jgi:uncharacterized membrane protein
VYAVSVWLHVVAATAWVGSMIFFAVVAVPVLRRADVRVAAPRLLRLLGARFRVLGWVSLSILLVTGVTNLVMRGIGWSMLSDGAFWATGFGRALAYKLALVAFVLVATVAHELLAGRRAIDAMESDPTSPQAMRTRAIASWLGRSVMLASLAILFFATTLVRGC